MTMDVDKRLYIGGLFDGVKEHELKDRFGKFGEVLSVEVKTRRNEAGETVKTFAYVHLQSTEDKLKKCFSIYNNSKWKGQQMTVQTAKEDFIARLRKERQMSNQSSEETKKKTPESKLEVNFSAAGVKDFTKKGAVPGTPIPGEKNWIVGKFGRVLPIVHVRRKDKKKLMKYDPSRHTHHHKRFDGQANGEADVSELTWELGENENENYKKRQGEFPEWRNVSTKEETEYVRHTKRGDRTPVEEGKLEKGETSVKKAKIKTTERSKNMLDAEDKVKSKEDVCSERVADEKTGKEQTSDLEEVYQLTSCSKTASTLRPIEHVPLEPEIEELRKRDSAEETEYIPAVSGFGDADSDFFAQEDDLLDRLEYDKFLKKKLEGLSSSTRADLGVVRNEGSFEIVTTPQHFQKHDPRGGFDRTSDVIHSTWKGRKLEEGTLWTDAVHSDAESVGSADTDEIICSAKKTQLREKKFEQALDSVTAVETPEVVPTKEKKQKTKRKSEIARNLKSEADRGAKEPAGELGIKLEGTVTVDHKSLGTENDSLKESTDKSNLKSKKAKKRTKNDNEETNTGKQKSAEKKRKCVDEVATNDAIGNAEIGDQTTKQFDLEKDKGSDTTPRSHNEAVTSSDFVGIDNTDENTTESDMESIESANTDEIITFAKREKLEEEDNQPVAAHSKGKTSKVGQTPDKKEDLVEKADEGREMETVTDLGPTSTSESDVDSSASAGTDEIYRSAKAKHGKRVIAEKEAVLESESDSESDSKSSDNSESEGEPVCEEQETTLPKKKRKVTDEPSEDRTVKVAQPSADVQNDGSRSSVKVDSDPKTETVEKSEKKDKKKRKKLLEKQQLSNQKRLDSLREKQQSSELQKSLIQKALASVDSKAITGHRIVFDSDDDEEDSKSPTKDKEKDSDDKLAKDHQNDVVSKKKKTEKLTLFDDDEDSESDEDDESRFQIKAQFEGSSGQKLLKLQERYQSDSRFQIDERFAESEEEEGAKSVEAKDDSSDVEGASDEQTYNLAEEKARQLNILQQLVGNKAILSIPAERKTNFKDTSKLRFDPTRKDHQQFETQVEEKQKGKGKERKQKEEAQVLPEVSKEKHFEVSDNLKEVFTEDKGFTFGFLSEEDEQKDKQPGLENNQGLSFDLEPVQKTPWQPKVFRYDSSEEEEEEGDENNEQKSEKQDESEKLRISSPKKGTKPVQPTFFFKEKDSRLQEGPKLFCRPDNDEEIKSKWEELIPTLQNDYRKQQREAMRLSRKKSAKRRGAKSW